MKKVVLKIKTIVRSIAKRFPAFRKFVRRCVYLYRRAIFLLHSFGINVDDKTVIFEAFSGKGITDSPKAIYEYMLTQARFDEYTYIWILKNPENYQYLLENKNTKIVRYNTKGCEKALAEAKYWIFNYRALDHWIPKSGQVYVQCWHGTPLKRLGYDITASDNAMNSLTEIRDKYKKDTKRFKYLLASCDFSAEKFKSAWNIENLKKENCIITVGYPRNDFLINHTQDDVERIKEKLGILGDKRKIILYAPTWRDNQHSSDKGYIYDTNVDFSMLQKQLGAEYLILFRAHYLVANAFDFNAYSGFVYNVSDIDDINELYIISDMLITDYSSVFFDFAVLKRPILFYMYDLEYYRDELRGFYLGLDELPGKIVLTEKELVKAIFDLKSDYRFHYEEFNERFNYLNDGKATERFADVIFK